MSEEEDFDFGTGIHIITISYNDDSKILPEIDLGDCSPWVAMTLLRAAMETLDLIIPPINVTYKGDVVIDNTEISDLFFEEDE
jgi:hypothetical protein